MRFTNEARIRLLIAEWIVGGAHGPFPVAELVEEETAPVCVQCGGNAETCRHAWDDGGIIK